MRTSTVLGVSISLATGIIVGWSFSMAKPEQKENPAPEPLFAYTPPTYIHHNAAISLSEPPHTPFDDTPFHPDHSAKLERAEEMLKTSRPYDALTALADASATIDLSTPTGKEWLRLLVDAYAATDNKEQLVQIFTRFPSALSSNEEAALAVANALIAQDNTYDYDVLRSAWVGKESDLPQWTFLDVQEKIIEGRPEEAISLLQKRRFTGKDETERLVRLAALNVAQDPKRAWAYLTEAAKTDPTNPDIHTYRASLGEMLNRGQTALSDYIVAVQKDPANPHRREQLADFYLRNKQYPQALKILQDTMTEPSLDTIWLKTLFWGRVAYPVKRTWKGAPVPEGSRSEFVSYLNTMPDDIFWNEGAFNRLPNKQTYLDTLQETFWLQLISDLKNGREEQASQLLTQNPFSASSWEPELEMAIQTILNFRQAKQNSSETLSLFPRASDIDTPKEMTNLLANLANTPPEQLHMAIPQDMHGLLLSKEAFVIPFLAAGWTEAAIQLHAVTVYPSSFPAWTAGTFAEALYQNRDANTALDFASMQRPSPALSLLVAELSIANNDKQRAFDSLKNIYTSQDTHGRQAALLLGKFLMEHNNPQDAKKAILAQPELIDNVAAKEILARIAVQEGDLERANELYTGLESESSEAKSFLAQKAYADKNWPRARQLTEALLVEFPENTTLKDNLKKIIAEQQKKPARN